MRGWKEGGQKGLYVRTRYLFLLLVEEKKQAYVTATDADAGTRQVPLTAFKRPVLLGLSPIKKASANITQPSIGLT